MQHLVWVRTKDSALAPGCGGKAPVAVTNTPRDPAAFPNPIVHAGATARRPIWPFPRRSYPRPLSNHATLVSRQTFSARPRKVVRFYDERLFMAQTGAPF